MKAVILAAGSGNRISAVARDTPKPLLPLDGQPGSDTFLDWHLRALHAAGVQHIFLVGNRVTFGTRLRAMREGIDAVWILNPSEDLSTSGSAHSAWFAFRAEHDVLDGRDPVILMDADILYDARAITDLTAGTASRTLVSGSWRETDEEVMVFADAAGRPRVHGKGLLRTPLVEGLTCIGEATGMLLFQPGDHAAVRGVTDWLMRFSTAKTRSEHEDITQRLMTLGRVEAAILQPDRAFMECDTPEEYRVLVEELYPRLAR